MAEDLRENSFTGEQHVSARRPTVLVGALFVVASIAALLAWWWSDSDSGWSDPDPGTFDVARGDLLLAHYDNRPDTDDIHSQAATATMVAWLEENEGLNVDDQFHAVLGAYGINQFFAPFVDSSGVMEICFGPEGDAWSMAHRRHSQPWRESVAEVSEKVHATLTGSPDSKVWILEGGQSDFTNEVYERLTEDLDIPLSRDELRERIVVIQHNAGFFNEAAANPFRLASVQENTTYVVMPNGNVSGNGSPGLKLEPGSPSLDRVKAHASSLSGMKVSGAGGALDACWDAAFARAQSKRWMFLINPTIHDGGLDFSDAVAGVRALGLDDDPAFDVPQDDSDVAGFFEVFTGYQRE